MPKRWLGVKPSGKVEDDCAPVDKLGPVEVRFRPVLPTDEQAMWMIGLQLWTAGAISHETLLEKFGQMDDPLGEIDRVTVDQALKNPDLMAQVVSEALRRAGIQPPPPPPMPGMPGAEPQVPGQIPGINSATGAGEPTIPGMNEPLPGVQAMRQAPRPGASSLAEHTHGGANMALRAGSYPGRPGGMHGQA